MALKTSLHYNINKDEIIGLNQTNINKTFISAKYALICMIRGININWKQSIAYFLVSSSCTGYDLKDIVFSTIQKLFNIDFNIKSFVTDMSPNFVSFDNTLNASPDRPY